MKPSWDYTRLHWLNTILNANVYNSSWLGHLTSREHAGGYMRRPCKGHEMGCLWLLLLKPNIGRDKWYGIHRPRRPFQGNLLESPFDYSNDISNPANLVGSNCSWHFWKSPTHYTENLNCYTDHANLRRVSLVSPHHLTQIWYWSSGVCVQYKKHSTPTHIVIGLHKKHIVSLQVVYLQDTRLYSQICTQVEAAFVK